MTTTHSSIPAFRAALLTRLEAALGGVAVSYGPPTNADYGERELVYFGAVRSSQVTAAMGQRRREETWQQDVVVSCISANRDSQQTLTERAFAIAALVEDSLRSWSAPGNAFDGIVRTALVVATDLDEAIDPKERSSTVTVRIDCANRI